MKLLRYLTKTKFDMVDMIGACLIVGWMNHQTGWVYLPVGALALFIWLCLGDLLRKIADK